MGSVFSQNHNKINIYGIILTFSKYGEEEGLEGQGQGTGHPGEAPAPSGSRVQEACSCAPVRAVRFKNRDHKSN